MYRRLLIVLGIGVVLIAVSLVSRVAEAQGTPFQWGSLFDELEPETLHGVYGLNCAAPLPAGDLAQFIYAGPDGQIDPPILAAGQDYGLPADDDVLLQTNVIDDVDVGPYAGHGYIPFEHYYVLIGVPPTPPGCGAVYIRAWNAASPAQATLYGDSQLLSGEDAEKAGFCAFRADADYNWPKWCMSETPTGVDVAYFAARATPDHVSLAWETLSEVRMVGFDIERARGLDGPWQKLNSWLIPAMTPGGVGGNSYTWEDFTAARGERYYYRLFARSPDGDTRLLDTTSVIYADLTRVWLPLLQR